MFDEALQGKLSQLKLRTEKYSQTKIAYWKI